MKNDLFQMEKLRKGKIYRSIAGPTLVIWYLWSIMFVCFSLSFAAEGTSGEPLAQDGSLRHASVMHGPAACDAQISHDAGSSYCETDAGPGVISDRLQLEIATLQIAWVLAPAWHETIALPPISTFLYMPTSRIFLLICSFLK